MAERFTETKVSLPKIEAPTYHSGRILKYALIGGVLGLTLFSFIGGLTSVQALELSLNKVVLGAAALGTS